MSALADCFLIKGVVEIALFKILKGPSSRISTDVTPFHDGYAFYTPDTGGFYIDAEYGGVQKRTLINPRSKQEVMSASQPSGLLSGDDWDKIQ